MRDQLNRTPEGIRLYRPADFAGMRRAGKLAAQTLDMLAPHVVPGMTTEQLDTLCHEFILENGARPAPLGYRGEASYPFPKSICTSINHVVCHGIPGPKALRDGDIVNVDVTVVLDGWYGDTSRMFTAGRISRKIARLLDITHECLMRGIATVRPGGRFSDIGEAIQDYAHAQRCSVVRDFCGHGLGEVFHDAPNVVHYKISNGERSGNPRLNAEFRPGMFFTIEPMINLGRPETKILADEWTAVTRDKSLSAQFEHSLGVTEDGVEIFTLSPAARFHPTRSGEP